MPIPIRNQRLKFDVNIIQIHDTVHSSYSCDLSCDLIAHKHNKHFLNVHNCLAQLIGAFSSNVHYYSNQIGSYLIDISYLVIEIVSLGVTKYG